MKKSTKFLLGAALAVATMPALAATPMTKPEATRTAPPSAAGSIQQGQMEVGGLFAWFKSDAYDLGLLLVSGGYMFTDEFEAKLSWTALLGDASGGFINPGVDYFLPIELPVLPYVGGGYAMGYGDAADLDSLEVHVGIKQFLTERIALDYRFTYQEPTDSAFDSSQIMQIGFAYYL